MDETVPSLYLSLLFSIVYIHRGLRVKERLFFQLSKAGRCLWVDCTPSVEHGKGGMTLLHRPNVVFTYICFLKLFVFPLKYTLHCEETVQRAWQTLKEIMCSSRNLPLWREQPCIVFNNHIFLLLSLKTYVCLVSVGYIQEAAVLCNWSADTAASNYFVFCLC